MLTTWVQGYGMTPHECSPPAPETTIPKYIFQFL